MYYVPNLQMSSKQQYDDWAKVIVEKFDGYTKEYFDFVCREDQLLLAEQFFRYLIPRKRHTLNVSVCRQVGKTDVLVMALMFALEFLDEVIGERIRICITAPEKGTSTEFFDRLKLACKDSDVALDQSNNDVIVLQTGNRVDKFGLFKGYARKEDKKTTREGRTFHIVVRDEKHMGDDYIYQDEIVPAMSTTGGLEILIGNGGFKNCKAKQISDMFPDKTQVVQHKGAVTNFEINYEQMREFMIQAYEETENEMFMRWVDSQDAYIEEHGEDSHLVKKNLYNHWITDISNLIGIDKLKQLGRDNDDRIYTNEVDLGLDLAKSQDRTVLTFTDHDSNVREWYIVKGEYTDQMREILDILMENKPKYNYRYMFVDSTGVGDPIKAMLKEMVGHLVTVRGIVFSPKEKDILVRKALKAFSAKHETDRFSYPLFHPLAKKFEDEITQCQKIIREGGKINYKHPDTNGAHDDFVDSTFLSLYKIQRIGGTEVFDTNTVNG